MRVYDRENHPKVVLSLYIDIVHLSLLLGVVGLSGLSLNHDGGVSVLIKLRLVRDGSHHIAGGQSQTRCQRRQCGDECHDNGFDNLFLIHNN